MGFVQGLVVLDEVVVGVALSTILTDLSMTQIESHWVVNAYLLVLTSLAVAGGRLGDRFGHRGFFMLGVAIFGLASLACGFAPTPGALIIARIIQGIGAAIIFPCSLAIITETFPPEQRGLAFGIHTAFGGVFMAIAPLIGGLFIETLSWRWIFWANLPIAIAVLGILAAAAPVRTLNESQERLDLPGVLLLTFGLAFVVTPLMEGPDWGWLTLPTLGLLIAAPVVLYLFTRIEKRTAAPLIDMQLASDFKLTALNLVTFTGQFCKIGVVVMLPLYLQRELHMSALDAGLSLLPAMILLPVSPLIGGRLTDRYGNRRPALAGLALHTVAMIGFAISTGTQNYAFLVIPCLIWSATLPFHYVPIRRAVLGSVSAEKRGQASGLTLTTQLLGGTMGMAILGSVLSITDSFQAVFLTSTGLAAAILLLTYTTIEKDHN